YSLVAYGARDAFAVGAEGNNRGDETAMLSTARGVNLGGENPSTAVRLRDSDLPIISGASQPFAVRAKCQAAYTGHVQPKRANVLARICIPNLYIITGTGDLFPVGVEGDLPHSQSAITHDFVGRLMATEGEDIPAAGRLPHLHGSVVRGA